MHSRRGTTTNEGGESLEISLTQYTETKGGKKVSFTINAAGQVYKQTIEFVYLGGAITADRDLSIEIKRRLQRAWACFQLYKMEIYDRPGVRLR